MRFAHIADCHLGGWRQPELRELNFQSFQKAIDISMQKKLDFVLIAGDLFDSAYPPIEILEKTFSEMKKLKDAKIPCYIIAGSHDYSASGKTFLSVLESAGFCQNIFKLEENNGKKFLNPTIHKDVAIYGYPGKKSGLEVEELKTIKLNESPGFFNIFALHTCIRDAIKNLPIASVLESELPKADYYALGHLHIDYSKNKFIYSGPTFPNNFQELEELQGGSIYIVNTSPYEIEKIDLKLKEVISIELEITDALSATEKIISELNSKDLTDKIILLKIYGKLNQGKTSHINFQEIESFAKSKQAYSILKSTSKLIAGEPEINMEIENMDKLEQEIIEKFSLQQESKFNSHIQSLVSTLSIEKQEGETSQAFESRLISELNKIININ